VTGERAGGQRRNADSVATGVFLAVLVLGLGLVGFQVVPHLDELGENPFAAQDETKTVVKKDAAGNVVETQITTEPDSGSLPERAFGAAGLLFVRIALVGLGAFVAAAIARKVLTHDYGIKVGGLEIESVASTTRESIDALELLVANIRRNHEDLKQDADSRLADASLVISSLTAAVGKLNDEVAGLATKVAPLTTRRPPPRNS
jgi:hypothetical protein